jgi:glycosyltransferase involved in cell wall biosynthesis
MAENNNAKKICIAIHGLAHAGAERVAASWANYLVKQGHDVFVLVYACSKDIYDLDEKVKVIPLADTREAYFRLAKPRQLLRIRKLIRQERPQIIISFLPKMQISMMLATLGMRVKRIETVRNNPWIDKDVEGKRFLWNLCFQRSDAIIVQIKEQSLYFSKRLQEKSVVISNPISREFVKQQKVYSSEGVCKFVAVARVNTQKNYPMMIRAFTKATKENPACTLDIYGAGSPEAIRKLQTLISQLGMEDKIHLCGWKQDISKLLPSYDAFLMSSDYEGMPNALAEAMASGLICLSTDCKTGPKDMIDSGKSGFLAKTGDEESFAKGIEKITQMNMQQCIAMGTAAREKILTMCSEKNTLARLKQLIETEV